MGRRSIEPVLGFTEAKPPGGYLVTSLSQLSPQVIADLIATLNPQLNIPVNQILGFQQYPPQQASVAASGIRTATTFGDLDTGAGPTLSNLADGIYQVFVSAWAQTSGAGQWAEMSVSPNGATPVDADAAVVAIATDWVSIMASSVQTLKAGNNTLATKYRMAGATATATFQYRRLIALRISNA